MSDDLKRLLDNIGHRWISSMTGASANPIGGFVVEKDRRLERRRSGEGAAGGPSRHTTP